jgi:hypothetical protein
MPSEGRIDASPSSHRGLQADIPPDAPDREVPTGSCMPEQYITVE